MKESFHERFRNPILAALACLVPLVLFGAMKALETNSNDVRAWLPNGLSETTEYAGFVRQFGSEEFVVVSWEGCTLDDPRVPRLAKLLQQRAVLSSDDAVDQRALIASVISGPQALNDLTDASVKLSPDEATARLRGLLVGPDGRQTCVIVQPTESGKRNPLSLLETIRREATSAGIPSTAIRMGGPPVVSSSIDLAAAHSLSLPGTLSVLGALIFSWICFGSLRTALPVIAIGAFSAAATLAVVWFTGGVMNAVLLSMPPLVYVATTSGAIHWANYYRETAAEKGAVGAPGRAVALAGLPLVLATVTTAMGLLSLCASELLPIRHFGLYAALGVAASLVWLLVVLPACFSLAPFRWNEAAPGPSLRPPTSFAWSAWGDGIARRNAAIVLICLTIAALCGAGLWRVKTTVSAEEFFAEHAELPRTSRWLEEHLGGTVPMELVVRFGLESQLTMLERIELIQRVQQSVAKLENVSTSVSAATFSPAPPEDEGHWTVRRSVFNRRLERNRDRIVERGFLAQSDEGELWRISLRTRSFRGVDQRYFIDSVRDAVEPVLQIQREASGEEISATYTGMVPLINRAQDSLLQGLCLGLATDLVLIVLTITVLMRHWSLGVVMFLACVVPAMTVLGVMGWLGVTLDIGTVLAPSVAIGVSVDDVLHFVLWFRRGLQQGLDRRQAVRLAYSHCARAMFQSWGVIGLGLGIFALSDFTPTHRFGLLMLLLVSVGLIVNLVMLPALLAGPLGGLFARSIRRVEPSEPIAVEVVDCRWNAPASPA